MRSVPVPGPGLFVPADIAAAIAPTLARALSDARRLGIYPDPEVAETIERLAVIGSAWAVKARLRRGTLRGVKSGRAWRVDAEAVRREAACR